ncbi:MAG: PLP-dependent cysteine synthase family protein [Alphaproteobacteria bacterium]|jgi:cysteine synthase|nr:PLP-dependent cysteine synthase family protein [Alphaproteobacteria bacterium]
MAFSSFEPVQFCEQTRLNSLAGMIGRTPLLAVHVRWKGEQRIIYAKAEHYNLTGSIKDRMALNILKCGYATGALKPGDMIVEATSGNAGIAMAALGRALRHPVRIYMPDWMSEERKCLLRSLGAELCLISREEGGFLGAIAATEALAETRDDVFLPRQFANCENCNAHEATTGPEILSQLASIGRVPDGFVAGVGTGGTVMGVGRALTDAHPGVKIHPLEPAESPTLSTGYKTGAHRIQGVSDDFIPAIVKLDEIDEVVAASDGDAIIMAQKLASELGLAVGISSGANLIGALAVQDQLGSKSCVATIFCDDNKKYLSTDLAREEPVKPGYIAPEVELIGFETIPYVAAAASMIA